MKTQLLTLITIAITSIAFAQKKNDKIIVPIDSVDSMVSYSEVIKVEGATKDDLYIRSREWFAKTFNSSRYVIQMDDKAAGKIIGKGSAEGRYSILLTSFRYYLNYTISVTVKDGRYRYEMSQFFVENLADKLSSGGTIPIEGYVTIYNKGKGSGSGIAKQIIPQLDNTSSTLAASLKGAMNQSASGTKQKDDF